MTGVWRKATKSNNSGACVEVRISDTTDEVSIRDSKYRRNRLNDHAAEPTITVTKREWTAFTAQLAGRANTGPTPLRSTTTSHGTVQLATLNTALWFTPDEWEAFIDGVHRGEFALELSAAA